MASLAEPYLVLSRSLQVNSVISSTSSFARRHQTAQASQCVKVFAEIGQGVQGVVFEVPDTDKLYYPRPAQGGEQDDRYWLSFKQKYIVVSKELLSVQGRQLAEGFTGGTESYLEGVQKEYREDTWGMS